MWQHVTRYLTLTAVLASAVPSGCRKPLPPPAYVTLAEDTAEPWNLELGAEAEMVDLATSDEPPKGREEALSGIEYLEVLTGGASHDQPLPLIVAIHSMGSRPEIMARVFNLLREPARVILPRGSKVFRNGF